MVRTTARIAGGVGSSLSNVIFFFVLSRNISDATCPLKIWANKLCCWFHFFSMLLYANVILSFVMSTCWTISSRYCNGFWWSFVTNLTSTLLMTKQWETGGIALQLFLIHDVHHIPTSLQLCLLYIEHILIYEEDQERERERERRIYDKRKVEDEHMDVIERPVIGSTTLLTIVISMKRTQVTPLLLSQICHICLVCVLSL